MSFEADMMRGLARVNYSAELSNAALQEFHQSCRAFKWTETEALRQKALAAFEAYLDTLVEVQRSLETAGAKPLGGG